MKTSVYFDTSAFVKRYVNEKGTIFVSNICNTPLEYQVYLSRITGIEVSCALKRALKDHRISEEDYNSCIKSIRSYFLNPSIFTITEFNIDVFTIALQLSDKYGLKGYDTVQLATAVYLRDYLTFFKKEELLFVCADEDLLNAAGEENLKTKNPESE